ncbi:HNH endonuclease signature motif containing protein [Nocardioides stalactiti]|uniref:HNH endonuclease signature motif containing protein n=1 Tax=Nocardioides stalactiti TaxID=2755356 RepID=UPI0015FFC605|nr:HNH endonuclease signature motif containing protein [Nocardioides stalactiti]
MDLGTTGSTLVGPDHRSTSVLLDQLAAGVAVRRRSEVEEFQNLIAWADANVVTDPEGAATIRDSYVDTGIPIAGPGAPLVSEFALSELCATLERSLDSGRGYVGKVIETGWRLPGIRDAVYAGKVPVWKALQVAELTRTLSAEAAAFVDRHLAFALTGCTWAQVERLVTEAINRFDPDTAEERRQDAADRRHCTIDLNGGHDGVVDQWSVLDTADALDLEQAIARRAEELRLSGCDESLDVRRSIALGEIARGDLALDLEIVDTTTGEITRVVKGRKVELFVHLTDAALAGVGNVGRLGNTTNPVLAEQIRTWCASEGTQVIVRPVIDLAEHLPVDSYEIPDRHRLQVTLRDHTCRAPWCNRKAERCDLDHAVPHADGGPTCPRNLVPLCRRHHRAKTFHAWTYDILSPGVYLWTSLNGRQFLVTASGTRSLSPPGHPDHRHPETDEPPWADPGFPHPNDHEPVVADPPPPATAPPLALC